MPTKLEDIAKVLNVSKMTVSRAINNHPEISRETRARVLQAAREMNYRPNQFARALTTNHSYLIGIVVPDLMHSYFAEICRGVESLTRPLGYQNLICSTDEEFERELEEVNALLSRTDGLIVASAVSSPEPEFYQRLISEGARIVIVDRLIQDLRCSSVTTDDVRVGLLATTHLIKLGHSKIGHLRGRNVYNALKRLQGYTEALTANGLAFTPEFVRDCGFSELDGYKAMSQWIKDGNLPTAIFAASDAAAIGAMAALNESHLRVPEDIAIVGAGNIHFGEMLRAPLTTVSWSTTSMGQAAARLLLELIDGKENSDELQMMIIEPELVVRESCGAGYGSTLH